MNVPAGHRSPSSAAVVIGAPDVSSALARFQREHPKAKVYSIQQAELDQSDDHPTAYLGGHLPVLVAGGGVLKE
jgi:hypothetical protein